MKAAILVCALLVANVNCKSAGSARGVSQSGSITINEIRASGLTFGSAYDIVRQFRPQWMRTRGISIIQPQRGQNATLLDFVGVYLDDTFLGEPDALREISALTVERIEHFDRGRAQTLGSRSHIHGAIVVHTRK